MEPLIVVRYEGGSMEFMANDYDIDAIGNLTLLDAGRRPLICLASGVWLYVYHTTRPDLAPEGLMNITEVSDALDPITPEGWE